MFTHFSESKMEIIGFGKSNLFVQETMIKLFFKNLKIKEPQNTEFQVMPMTFSMQQVAGCYLEREVDLEKAIKTLLPQFFYYHYC